MLTITATNFGVNPADIQINSYLATKMVVLDGDFAVDTTAEEYAGIRPMQLTVGDLPFSDSQISTAIVTVESEGVKYATITKVWITDKNTINIAKVLPYKSAGSYVVKFRTALIPKYITGEVVPSAKRIYVPEVTKGAATGVEVYTTQAYDWMAFVFKAETLTFDETDNEVVMTLPDFPTQASGSFPVFYNEGLWVALGSKYYPATLANGTLTISKNGNADEADNAGFKFTRAFLVTTGMNGGYGADED